MTCLYFLALQLGIAHVLAIRHIRHPLGLRHAEEPDTGFHPGPQTGNTLGTHDMTINNINRATDTQKYTTHHDSEEEFEKQAAHLKDDQIFSNLCGKPPDIMYQVSKKCSHHEEKILQFMKSKNKDFDAKYIERTLEVMESDFICFEHDLHYHLWQCMCQICDMPIMASIEERDSLYYKWRHEYYQRGCDKQQNKQFPNRPDSMCKWLGVQTHNTKRESNHPAPKTPTQAMPKQDPLGDSSSSPVQIINYTWVAMMATGVIASLGAFFIIMK